MNKNFPKTFIIPSELDIIVLPSEMEACVNNVESLFQNIFLKGYQVQKRMISEQHVGIVLYCHHKEILYFDIQTTHDLFLSEKFNDICIMERILAENDHYYICLPKYDLLIRALEYIKYNHKYWHRDYIKKHINDYDETALNWAIEDDFIRGKVKQLMNEINESKCL
jgi:hypothetical protein